MKSLVRLASFILAALLLAGCVTHHYGDAQLREKTDLITITPDRLHLRPVPLDRVEEHTLQVRDLPFPIYPTALFVPITPMEADLKQAFPWEDVRLHIEFRTLAGEVFFTKDLALADAERGRSPATYHQIELQFRSPGRHPWRAPEDMPHYTSYDVVVKVLQPSQSKNHRATLYGDTFVK